VPPTRRPRRSSTCDRSSRAPFRNRIAWVHTRGQPATNSGAVQVALDLEAFREA
jgi:hypothetical protein